MDNKQENPTNTKTMPCACTAVLGVLVVVFAWWKVSWGSMALTVIGALIILKGLINKCCCSDAACEIKKELDREKGKDADKPEA